VGSADPSDTLSSTIGTPPTEPGAWSLLVERLERGVVVGLAVFAIAFLMLPIVIIVPMSFSSASTLTFPPPGLSLRWYEAFFTNSDWLLALLNSFVVGLASSLLSLLLGSIAAYGLVRRGFIGSALVDANFMAPLIVPPIIIAVALYIFFAKLGLLGRYDTLIIAHTVLTTPYVVLIMSVAVSYFDQRIEDIARSLGAGEITVFRRVLIPNLLPSVLAAWTLAFIVSFDEVVLTLFLFGNNYTIPKRMFTRLELQIDPTITAIATMLIAFSIITLAIVALMMRSLRDKIFR
jgi:ABC-type spermidine/putrescine transport system permease subunit II